MKKKLMVVRTAAALANAIPGIGRLPGQVVTDYVRAQDNDFFKRAKSSPAERVRENARLKRQGGYFNIDLTAVLVGAAVVGMLLGSVVTIVAPWLWGVVKPLLHALTS